MRKVLALLLCACVMLGAAACGSNSGTSEAPEAPAAPPEGETTEGAETKSTVYYYVGINNNHAYWYDVHQGFEYAADKLGVEVVKAGVDGWDPEGQAAALESVIARNPDGIIVPVFDATILPGLDAAAEAGIPVVAIESSIDGAKVVSYVGLDNYDSGEKTAQKLIELAGTSGNLVIMGNWGAANTDAKRSGLEDYLAANSQWNVIARLDDKADTESAIEAAKTAFNNYPEMTAVVGLDSSSGAGIGAAMEELNIEAGAVSVVVHDREVLTLEYIQKGYIQCTLANKTASMPFMALMILEGVVNHEMQNLPLSADNAGSGVNAVPEICYNGTVFITEDNVDNFIAENMVPVDSPNYN